MERDLPKEYLSYPKMSREGSKLRRIAYILAGIVLFPFYWLGAYAMSAPGLSFRRYCIVLGVRVLYRTRDVRRAYNLIVAPMDSVRYFEFHFMWQAMRGRKIRAYLDVSSPRLFPLIVAYKTPDLVVDLINPDKKDLPLTISFAEAFGVSEKCRFHPTLVEDAAFEPESFDVISSMSVVEHIPDDLGAIRKMWDLLKPGGVLLITVPCAPKASEEYININEYELIESDRNGYVFWQRYYDETMLQQRIFSVTGLPVWQVIYGEKKANNYQNNVTQKRLNEFYPYWREPFMMGCDYAYSQKLSDLPGMGVIGMEFRKPK